MFNIFKILGIAGSILVGISFIPQTYIVIKKKEIKNLSIGLF